MSVQRATKTSGRNPGNNFVGILEETIISWGHYKINWTLAALKHGVVASNEYGMLKEK